MVRTTNLDLSHRTALQTGQEHPADAVANGHAKTALKRFSRKFAVLCTERRTIDVHDAWKL